MLLSPEKEDKMSSSSSESDEDDTRFKEACDPILSKAFNVSYDQQEMNGKQVETHSQNGQEEIDNTENRQSFLLLSKIQQSLKNHKDLPLSKGISLYQRNITSKEEKKHKEPTKPSYLARQLSSILDQNVEFSKKEEVLLTDESKTKNSMLVNDEHKKPEEFSLLHGVSLSLTAVGQQISKKTIEKNKQRKLNEYCGGLDEEMLFNRCRNIAVTPEWILQKQGDYPWPHPKNIRFIDKYKAKKKHANGAVVLTPINDGNIDKKKDKMKPKSSLDGSVNKKAKETLIKSQLEVQNKKRKQSRKRGGKKKKNEQKSILSDSKKT